jgi:hypothetical protein
VASSGSCLCALQRFRRRPLDSATLPLPVILSWNRLLVQWPSCWYRGYWFRNPVSPLALASALRSSQTGRRSKARENSRSQRSSSSVFLQSLSRSHLVARAAKAGTRHLSWASCSLQHVPSSGVHSTRVCLARFVPPSGFGYPPGGLLPPGPGQPCFMPTALLGFCPSELSPRRRVSRTSPSGMDPPAVSPTAAPADESASRPGRPRLLGFDLSGSPLSPPVCLAPTATGCSLGLSSFPGYSTGRLVHTPVQTPLTRLATRE